VCDEQPEFGGARMVTRPRLLSTASRATTGRRPPQVAKLSRDGQCAGADRARPPSDIRRKISCGLARAGDRAPGRPDPNRCRANGCGRCAPSSVMIATGAIERHMVFANNDRPGIMLASAARTYLNHHRCLRRQAKVGVYTACDSAPMHAAIDLKKAGSDIACDRRCARSRSSPGGARQGIGH
jgi:hypothetical protein